MDFWVVGAGWRFDDVKAVVARERMFVNADLMFMLFD